MSRSPGLVEWLMESDPALRWQVLRDLLDAPEPDVARERARVAREGWGALLLALQGPDGQWAGGAYWPAGHVDSDDESGDHGGEDPGEPPEPGTWEGQPQPWTATQHTLELLCLLGADPQDDRVRAAVARVRDGCRWEEGGQRFFDGEVEPCINGRTVAIGAYVGQDVGALVERLVAEQLADGGWNCWAQFGATRSSFHTTIDVVEGLLAHERATGGTAASIAARRGGEEYLLARHLFRRSTGEPLQPVWLQFSFPTWWHYDVLRGLEHFRSAGVRDPRLGDAIDLVREKRQPDGTWLLENTHPGEVHLALDDGDGRPSRWNTLRALRVLRWYEG